MRGAFEEQGGLFSYIALEERVPGGHPLRKIRAYVRAVLADMDRTFSRMYAKEGRPSIPPEQLFSALLLQAFYSVRSERQLMEQIHYNLLFRWFCGLSPDTLVWDATTFTKNRERLQRSEVFETFMRALLRHPKVEPLLSNEHFSVDGTLIEAWASHKSFKPKDGSGHGDGGENFHGQKRKNDTHVSTTDPDSRLYRKAQGREAKLFHRQELVAPPLAELARLDDAAFRTLFAGSPVKRAGRDRFVRNVLIAIGNSGEPALAATAEALIGDASPLVRAMAVWALARLAPARAAALRSNLIQQEQDSAVRAEWLAA